ncbi:MAG TPA: ABC transporter permease subunit [Gaiellales bacterium]|nr:ABC transporter permease subunit [Gaiellales bacterium]
MLPPLLLLVFLIVLPAITAIIDTLTPDPAVRGLTPEVYRRLLASRFVRSDIIFTVTVTVVSVAVTFGLSYPLALYLRFARGRLPALLSVLFTIPLFVPVVIASFAMITFLVNHGLISTVLYRLGIERFPSLVYNATGIVLTEVWASIPFAVLILGAGLQAIDDALIDGARDVGAGPVRTFGSIILPLNVTPTMIALTLLFINVFGSFTIPYLVGGNAPQMLGVTMTNYLTQYLRRTEAVTMAVMAFAISAVVGAVYVVSVSRRERGTA